MALTGFQQAFELLNRARTPLVVAPLTPSVDTIASATSLGLVLKRSFGKDCAPLLTERLPSELEFIAPYIETLRSSPSFGGDVILTIDTRERKIKELRYEKKNDRLTIFLTPQGEPPKPEDISHEIHEPRHDLIITCGAHDLESLGDVFEKRPHLFFETPILNIDHQSGNEEYGEVNLVDSTASSTSEVVGMLLESVDPRLIDRDIATVLLTGIISKTENFRNHLTRPRTLSLAASLMSKGADHETIIKYLYKTRPLTFLKLFGKTLAEFKPAATHGIGWAYLKADVFSQTDTSPDILPRVVQEMREYFPYLKLIMFFWETPDPHNIPRVRGLAWSASRDRMRLVRELWGGETKDEILFIAEPPQDQKTLEQKLHELTLRYQFMIQ